MALPAWQALVPERARSYSRRRCCTISPSQSAPRSTARAASVRRAMPARVSSSRARCCGAMPGSTLTFHSRIASRLPSLFAIRAAAVVSGQARPGAGRGSRQPDRAARPCRAAGRGGCARANLCRSARIAGSNRSVSAVLRRAGLPDAATRVCIRPQPLHLFRNPDATLHYDAYDDTRFEVIMMCGLPAPARTPGCAGTPRSSRSSRSMPFARARHCANRAFRPGGAGSQTACARAAPAWAAICVERDEHHAVAALQADRLLRWLTGRACGSCMSMRRLSCCYGAIRRGLTRCRSK